MSVQDPFLGTELKLNIHIDPIDGQHMADYNFEVEVYCNPKKSITATKTGKGTDEKLENLVNVKGDGSQDNYIVLVDSNEIGSGNIMCKITAYLPDDNFKDGFRTEVVVVDTGIVINK